MPQDRRRLVRLLLALLVFIIVASILFSYSLLTVSSSSNGEKTVYLNNESGNISKQFTLGKASKTLIVRRGAYKVNVVEENKQSIYEKKVAALANNKLEIETIDQKASLFAGTSELSCSKNRDGQPVYYACKPSSAGVIQALGAASPTQLAELPASGTFSQALKPRGDGFLSVALANQSLTIKEVADSGHLVSDSRLNTPEFTGSLTDNSFSVSADSDNFALFNRSKNQILKFKNGNDKNPAALAVPADSLDEHFDTTVISGKDFTYLASYTSEMHKHEEDEELAQQKILVFDSDNKLVKEHDLPSDWRIRGIAPGPDNKVLVFLSKDVSQAYLIQGESSFERVSLGLDVPQEACWKDSGSFYYSSNSSRAIYLHSLEKKASFLVYEGLPEDTLITGINCSGGNLSFTLDSDRDAEIDKFTHYFLGENSHNGTRLEAVLPLYFSTDTAAFKAGLDRNGIRIDAIYGSQDKVQTASKLEEELRSKGVVVDRSKFIFGF